MTADEILEVMTRAATASNAVDRCHLLDDCSKALAAELAGRVLPKPSAPVLCERCILHAAKFRAACEDGIARWICGSCVETWDKFVRKG